MPVSDTLADPVAEPNTWKATVLDPWVDDVSDAIAALEAGGGAVSDGRVISTVTPGANNSAALQAELNALAAGAIYVLKAGETYSFSSVTLPSNVTLRAHGAVCQPVTGSAANTPALIVDDGNDNSRIEGGTWKANGVSYADGSGVIAYTGTNAAPITNHVREDGRFEAPVYGTHVRQSTFRRNKYVSTSTVGQVTFREGIIDIDCDNEWLSGGGGNGYSFQGTTVNGDRIRITKPTILDFDRMGIECHWGCGTVTISDPLIETTSTSGTVTDRIGISIASDVANGDLTRASIVNPQVTMPSSSYACIELAEAAGSTVIGGVTVGGEFGVIVNATTDTSAGGRGGSIKAVQVRGFNSVGILLFNYTEGIEVSGCTVELTDADADNAIQIDGGSGNTHDDGGKPSRGCTIVGNTITVTLSSPAATRSGIAASYCQDTVIRDNRTQIATTSASAFQYGINLHGIRFVIEGNSLQATSATNTRGIGTAGGDAAGSRIFNNTITGFDRGIVLDDVDMMLLGGNYSDNANPDTAAFVGVGGRSYTITRSFGPDALATGTQ